MSSQPTLWDMPSATSSRAFPAGRSPCNSPDGPTAGPSGPEAAPASRSRRQASGRDATIPGISGLSSADSSLNASHRWSLASKSLPQTSSGRLQERLGQAIIRRLQPHGSMEYKQAWKVLVTPAGFTLLAHTASARRTSGSDCSGWPSPRVQDASTTLTGNQAEINEKGRIVRQSGQDFSMALCDVVKLSGWPTPNIPARGAESRESKDNRGSGGLDLQTTAAMAGWATPRQEDGESAGMRHSRGTADTLSAQVGQDLAGWSTPCAEEAKAGTHCGPKQASLGTEARGTIASSSPAVTERRGVLNPAFPLWLMGFPAHWQRSCPGWQSWDTIQRLLQGC